MTCYMQEEIDADAGEDEIGMKAGDTKENGNLKAGSSELMVVWKVSVGHDHQHMKGELRDAFYKALARIDGIG